MEGIWIRCRNDQYRIKYGVQIHPDSSSKEVMVLASGPDVWFYATMVWSVGQPIVIYENGLYVSVGNWETGPGFVIDVNTKRNLAFGLLYTDDTNQPVYGRAYIDGVRMFNRPLSAAEVQALYQSYGNTETTIDPITTTEQFYTNKTEIVSKIDISSNLTELNMETAIPIGNAMLNMVLKMVSNGEFIRTM